MSQVTTLWNTTRNSATDSIDFSFLRPLSPWHGWRYMCLDQHMPLLSLEQRRVWLKHFLCSPQDSCEKSGQITRINWDPASAHKTIQPHFTRWFRKKFLKNDPTDLQQIFLTARLTLCVMFVWQIITGGDRLSDLGWEVRSAGGRWFLSIGKLHTAKRVMTWSYGGIFILLYLCVYTFRYFF